MNDTTPLHVQALELQRLLKGASDNPILRPQIEERLEEIQSQLEQAQLESGTLLPLEPFPLPRAAIFLRGGGVEGSFGINADLAGNALLQYGKMFEEQALHDERESLRKQGKQRRPKGAASPGLLFVGTPRGSFGLEFVPQNVNDHAQLKVHAKSLENVATAIILIAESDGKQLAEVVDMIPPRVIPPLKLFFRTLATNHAELRIASSSSPSKSLKVEQLESAANRLEREVSEEINEVKGTFRGLTLDSGQFDIRDAAGEIISGVVSDEFSDDQLEALVALTNQDCVATLQITTVQSPGSPAAKRYVLLSARSTDHD